MYPFLHSVRIVSALYLLLTRARCACTHQAAVCLKVLLERPKSHLQEDNLPTMCAILAKMLEDTSADVRTNAKAAFERCCFAFVGHAVVPAGAREKHQQARRSGPTRD